ncbi:HNH endonuclease [Aeromicrobium yanjiei]|uniref:DUF222 domain-containing protein n=2 Tax=Aeromicrobium TaxID=2040 RepID=A0A5Q2MC49_9ACTN|nr:HNH endonuclease signature motif containing protein [Aeromicrobium yanjiei]QGG40657.1 DUF222 domain-containing protein [Aeromicrobium yanjiei]
MNPKPTIDAMRTAAQALSSGDVRETLHAVQMAQDALDAVKGVLLAELQASKDFELDGASTLNTWVRNQLHLKSGQATVLVKSVAALRDLPLVAEAATSGLISAAHVQVFVYGLAHVGLEPMLQHEEVLVAVAAENEPGVLWEAVKHLKAITHPEDLDEAWKGGMDKEDFAVDALPDGFHVTGFLNTLTGLKLKKVMDSVSAPRDADDTRTGAQRRVQGLDDLLDSILGNGLPSDKGVRPHMSVFVDAETLEAAAERVEQETEHPHLIPDPMPESEPATLAGHGAIGPHLLMFLFCLSGVTGFVREQDQILNVGHTRYEPNMKQRKAVLARQRGVCATPGCNHTHLEVHHSVWWSLGGRTDLDQLVGLCVRCHHLVHRGLLHVAGNAVDGFEFTNRHQRPVRRRRRTGYRRAA